MSEHLVKQPQPRRGVGVEVWKAVMDDMAARNEFGIVKYGGPLEPHDGRYSLADAYQEALDLAVYLKQELMEGDRYQNWFACWRICFELMCEAERTGEWRVAPDQQEAILAVFGRRR